MLNIRGGPRRAPAADERGVCLHVVPAMASSGGDGPSQMGRRAGCQLHRGVRAGGGGGAEGGGAGGRSSARHSWSKPSPPSPPLNSGCFHTPGHQEQSGSCARVWKAWKGRDVDLSERTYTARNNNGERNERVVHFACRVAHTGIYFTENVD